MALELLVEGFMGAAKRIGEPEELEGWYAYCVGVDDGLLYQPLSKLVCSVRSAATYQHGIVEAKW
jgi:hypothetical protein